MEIKGLGTNTYVDIEKYLVLSSLSSSAINLFLQSPDELKATLSMFTTITGLTYITLFCSGAINHTTDIKQIRDLYQTFIKNYNKLNKEFDFNNPVQIHTMFNYLIYKGYLSSGKEFEFSSSQAKDLKPIYGANIITGQAVCRHIASALTDILNDYDIEAGTIGVCAEKVIINVKMLDEQKYTKEELINWLHSTSIDENTISFLTLLVEKLDKENALKVEFQYLKEKEKDTVRRVFGNHAITYAYKDGKSYYLDPTQDRIYRPEGKILSDSEIVLSPKMGTAVLFKKKTKKANMKKRIAQKYPTLDTEEQKRLQEETLDICRNNMDAFEQFYKENEELYDETSNMILSLKNRYSILRRK